MYSGQKIKKTYRHQVKIMLNGHYFAFTQVSVVTEMFLDLSLPVSEEVKPL